MWNESKLDGDLQSKTQIILRSEVDDLKRSVPLTFCTPIMFISYPKKSNPHLTSSYHEYQRCGEAPFAGWRLCSLPVGNEGFQPCLQVGCWNEAMKNKVLEDGWQLWNLYVRGRVHGNVRFDAFCITVCTDCIYISMLTYLHRRIISY